MTTLKYVRVGNNVILFSETLLHSTFKYLEPTSAGFCTIDYPNRKVVCYGESISLKLKSDVEDSDIATLHLFRYNG